MKEDPPKKNNELSLEKVLKAMQILSEPSGWETRRMGLSIHERERTQVFLDSRGRLMLPMADGMPKR